MTENEYVLATNLVAIRIARGAVRDHVMPLPIDGVREADITEALKALRKIEDALAAAVEIKE